MENALSASIQYSTICGKGDGNINYYEVKNRLRELELPERRDIRYGVGKVRPHNRQETIEHWIAKCLITKILLDKSQGIVTECEFRDGRVVDVLSVLPHSFVGYEIESTGINNKSDVKNVDMITIDLTKCPKQAIEGIKLFEEWLEQYLVV